MMSGRTELLFNEGWEFALTDRLSFPEAGDVFRPVLLPHDWSVDYPPDRDAPSCGSGGYARTGIGWYRKSFDWAPSPREVSLVFGGVYMNCDLWLNGARIGGHAYGYTSFEVPLAPWLREGRNDLLVRVNNSQQPNSRWYSGSGIIRNVTWLEWNPVHIPLWGVQVTAQPEAGEAALQIRTEIRNPAGREDLILETRILDPEGRTAAAWSQPVPAGRTALVQSGRLAGPSLWEPEHPALYTAETRLAAGEECLDLCRTVFGIRSAEFTADRGFLLNGKKVLLRGVCLHHDGGCTGAAVPPEIWRRRLEKLKDMGCNALRCSHNPPDPAILDLADEMGFLVMDEAFDEWQVLKGKEFGSNTHSSRGYSEWFDSCWQDDVASMVRRDRNHPSVIMWSVGNEIGEQTVEGGDRILKELAGLCHALDPSRPVTAACDQVKAEPIPAGEAFLNEADLVGVNYADRWRDRTETFFMEEKLEHPDWKLLGTEDIAVNGRRGDYRLETEESVWGRTPYYARMLKAEKLWKFLRTRPFMIGSFMWTGIDYLGECFWPDKGASAGVLDTCGFEKDGFWFYRSLWREDVPTLFAAPFPDPAVYGEGRVIPVVVYTNAFSAELFLGERSYGVKAYEFPGQGMTRHWAHFDRKQCPVTTNDLHLSWDVPCTGETVTVIAYDIDGKETARRVLKAPGLPARLAAEPDRKTLPADGKSIVQIEIGLLDENGDPTPAPDRPVTLAVENGTLLGMDNGNPADHTLYACAARSTFRGRALAVIRAGNAPGTLAIRFESPGLPAETVVLPLTAPEGTDS